jgi:hypothetical protein
LEPEPQTGIQVLVPEVARTVRNAMAEVVEHGTARRLAGVFRLADGQLLTVGGKTGSGDNKFETFNRYGGVISSRATNRTAASVFSIGDRYFGVITAYVQGREAADYRFTSALPVTLMKILAPTLIANIDASTARPSENLENVIKGKSTPRKISFNDPSPRPAPVTVAH